MYPWSSIFPRFDGKFVYVNGQNEMLRSVERRRTNQANKLPRHLPPAIFCMPISRHVEATIVNFDTFIKAWRLFRPIFAVKTQFAGLV